MEKIAESAKSTTMTTINCLVNPFMGNLTVISYIVNIRNQQNYLLMRVPRKGLRIMTFSKLERSFPRTTTTSMPNFDARCAATGSTGEDMPGFQRFPISFLYAFQVSERNGFAFG